MTAPPEPHGNRIPESYLRRFMPSGEPSHPQKDAMPEGLAAFLSQLGLRDRSSNP